MPYETKPMKKQWLEVDGRLTPIILPQIWNHGLQDWVVTSEQNPLPTQVTGSIVEVYELLEGESIPPESSLTFHLTFRGSKFGINGRWQNGNHDITSSYSFNEYKNESGTRYIGSMINLFSDINFLETEDKRKVDMTSPTVMFTIKNNSTDREVVVRHIYITDYY